jgi:hypothetical protein
MIDEVRFSFLDYESFVRFFILSVCLNSLTEGD